VGDRVLVLGYRLAAGQSFRDAFRNTGKAAARRPKAGRWAHVEFKWFKRFKQFSGSSSSFGGGSSGGGGVGKW
jgi:hypothetical protein